MIKTMLRTINQYQMIANGDRVLVGLSGGPDSMALLHALHATAEQLGCELLAVHVHHGIRGCDADLDEQAAQILCEKLQIPIIIEHGNVPEVAERLGISLETAGRQFRYQVFKRIMEEHHCTKLATAHHADDQCETFLMRLFRGTGSYGLQGIHPIRKEGIVRPLIDIEKRTLEAYCNEHQLGARVDLSNLEIDYRRNQIRNRLIPLIKEQYAPKFTKTVTSLTKQIAEENDFLESCAKQWIDEHVSESEVQCIRFNVNTFQTLHSALKSRVIIQLFEKVSGSRVDLSRVHVQTLLDVMLSTKGSQKIEFFGVMVERNYGDIRFTSCITLPDQEERNIDGSAKYYYPNLKTMSVSEYMQRIHSKDKEQSLYLDAETIDNPKDLVWRHRVSGDRFRPNANSGAKSLKSYLIDLKIPRGQRDQLWVLASGSNVLWIYGVALSRIYEISPETSNILEIQPPECCEATRSVIE